MSLNDDLIVVDFYDLNCYVSDDEVVVSDNIENNLFELSFVCWLKYRIRNFNCINWNLFF